MSLTELPTGGGGVNGLLLFEGDKYSVELVDDFVSSSVKTKLMRQNTRSMFLLL